MLAIGFASCSALAAPGGPAVRITTNYYSISGSTVRELRAALDQSRPWKDRRPSDAFTDWNIQWTYSVVPTETGCRLRSFEARTTITITLPKWAGPDRPPDLAQSWDNYCKALVKHEEGHCAIAQAAAAEMRKRIGSLKETSTCEALEESIKKTANQAVAEYREKEADYDRKTESGATQGARFP